MAISAFLHVVKETRAAISLPSNRPAKDVVAAAISRATAAAAAEGKPKQHMDEVYEESRLVVTTDKKDFPVTVRHRAARHNILLRTSVSSGARRRQGKRD